MNDEEKKRKLDLCLQEGNFNYEFFHPPNIAEPILLIKDYMPATGRPPASFAFTLIEHYNQDNGSMGRKCWMTCATVKKIDEKSPNPRIDYKKFNHNGIVYFPFSVDLTEYTYNDIESLRRLYISLYKHLVFST